MAIRLAVNKFGDLGIGGVQVTIFPGSHLLILDQMAVVNAQPVPFQHGSAHVDAESITNLQFSAGTFSRDDDAHARAYLFKKGAEGLCALGVVKCP